MSEQPRRRRRIAEQSQPYENLSVNRNFPSETPNVSDERTIILGMQAANKVSTNPRNHAAASCPKCGAKVSERASFCETCGHPLKKAVQAKRRTEQLLYGMIVFLLATLFVVILFAVGGNDEKTATPTPAVEYVYITPEPTETPASTKSSSSSSSKSSSSYSSKSSGSKSSSSSYNSKSSSSKSSSSYSSKSSSDYDYDKGYGYTAPNAGESLSDYIKRQDPQLYKDMQDNWNSLF